MKKVCLVLVSLMLSQVALAGDCEIITERTACPGKETEALKPYNGEKKNTEKEKAASAEACEKKAEKASKIIRKGVLSAKSVTVKFDGKDLGKTFADKADCK